MKKTVLFAVVVAGSFVLSSSAFAADALLSPRAQEQANSLKKVPAVAGGPNLTMNSLNAPGSPRSREQAQTFVMGSSTSKDIDYVHAPRPNLSAKDPRFEAAWRQSALDQQIQVAPLK